ncbi:MAG: hypothetical protein AAF985_16730 [Bacteroidota bacterium]
MLDQKEYKLYTVIQSLEKKEVRQLRKMLKSPFFTRRADVRQLFEVLIKRHLKGKVFPRDAQLFKEVFPGEAWDDLKLRGTRSDLLELIEEYLMIAEFRNDAIQSKLLMADIYRRRNLAKCYTSAMKQCNQLINIHPKRNADYYQYLLDYQVNQMKYQSSTKRTEHLYLQEISDTNDVLYLIQKLQMICAQLSHQLVYKTDYHFGLLTNLLEEIGQEKYLKIPAIAVYYYCFRFLTESEQLTYFQSFKNLLNDHRHQFSKEDLEAPYRLALNLCIRKINEGEHSFVRDSWELSKEGLAAGILFENSYIPRFTFNNAIAAALLLEEFNWVAEFIEQYSIHLEPTFREQTISFNLARLSFAKEEYEQALLHLQSAEYKDLVNNLISKMLLIKIYWELQSFEALLAHLDSFQQFIRRREVSDYHRINFLNTIRYVRKIAAIPSYDKAERARIRRQIQEEEILTQRNWLLERVLTASS